MAKVTATGWGAEGTNAADPNYLKGQAEKWPGKHSDLSSKKSIGASAKAKRQAPSAVPATGSPLKTGPKGSGSARGAAGKSGGGSSPSDRLPAHPKGPVDDK